MTTALAYYGAFCLGCTAAFAALVAQAARRDRKAAARRAAWLDSQALLEVAVMRYGCVGHADFLEWDREMEDAR